METSESFKAIFEVIRVASRERRQLTGHGIPVNEAMYLAYRAGFHSGRTAMKGMCYLYADTTPEEAPAVVVDTNSAGSRLSREAGDDTRFGYLEELS
jgi:hypothetical protein